MARRQTFAYRFTAASAVGTGADFLWLRVIGRPRLLVEGLALAAAAKQSGIAAIKKSFLAEFIFNL
jgi:hypothetical protein